MDWEKYGFIAASKFRVKVLSSLKHAKTPTQIGREIDSSVSNVSRTLRDFTEKDIAQCMTPKARVGKIYKLTKKGQEMLDYHTKSTVG